MSMIVSSPLNYTGGKARLLPQIRQYFPLRLDYFVDLFCGGGTVGANTVARFHCYNDSCAPVVGLLERMARMEADEFLAHCDAVIRQYGLSESSVRGYAQYGCDGANGLAAWNREPFLRLRADFNALRQRDDEWYVRFFVLVVFAFNNQIRFNRQGDFNLPVGKRDLNAVMRQKVRAFMRQLSRQQATFHCGGFDRFDFSDLTKDSLVYCDPPYLITTATYTEGGGWTEMDELLLLRTLDELNAHGLRFALSNVLRHKGLTNEILMDWIAKRDYHVHHLVYSYGNANYQTSSAKGDSDEVLIVNYESERQIFTEEPLPLLMLAEKE